LQQSKSERLKGIDALFNPKSLAVVGATNREGSVGLAVFRNLLNAAYQGVLYPVNPRAKSIQGVKAYPSLTGIPDEVDMAVIVVPAEAVSDVVVEAGRKKVKACVVITAGFKEIGGEGVELERRVKAVARENGILILGPNCLGVINASKDVSMNASFARLMPKGGNVAVISQSGALGTSMLDYAAGRNIGFSKFVSIGNKADINEIDLLEYLKDDPETDVILMYLEDIVDGSAFMQIARETTLKAGKPIFALKSGRSAEGAKAAASHTGSMAGSDASYDAIFRQSGIERVEGMTQLFDFVEAFCCQPLPKGDRIAIITNAGGPGIMATDAAIRHGLKLATLSEKTLAVLRKHLPPTASLRNPVDVIGDADYKRYEAAIRAVLLDEGVDGAIVILTPQAMTDILETAEIVPRVAKDISKPVLSSFMGLVDVSAGVKYLLDHNIPNYTFPEAAARTMAAMVRYAQNISPTPPKRREVFRLLEDKEKADRIIQRKLKDRDVYFMPENEASELLRCYAFPLLKKKLIRAPEEIAKGLEEIGPPVVMKIDSPDILHKSDAGGVMLGIKTLKQAESAYKKILQNAKKYKKDAKINGVLMVEMAGEGVEVILGSTRDPRFGPVCMFGLGGIFVEVLQDVTFRLAPMWQSSAKHMIQSIKSYRVLKGIRGKPASDIKAVQLSILRLSALVSNHPEIKELDINPMIIYPEGKGCVVADARIVLARPEARPGE
jgi:acetate---CoA ligase (ADP-forming)